jgi:hypothetical protein
MEAVDESVRLVKLSAQPRFVAVIAGGPACRYAAAPLGCFDFLRDLGDLAVQRCQQYAGLSCLRVVDHLRILSPILTLRVLTMQGGQQVNQRLTVGEDAGKLSTWLRCACALQLQLAQALPFGHTHLGGQAPVLLSLRQIANFLVGGVADAAECETCSGDDER